MASDSKADDHPERSRKSCGCWTAPPRFQVNVQELGLDSRLAGVSIFVCQDCGQSWLRYFYEVEAFTGSARWYVGAVCSEQISTLVLEQAKDTLEKLDWYYYGGSYYGGQWGRTSGKIVLNP